jgi:hypothetical protein
MGYIAVVSTVGPASCSGIGSALSLAEMAAPAIYPAMLVIRRLVDRQQAYTALFLPGEEPRIFPSTDYEHGRILQIYKQDRPYTGVHNDFSEFGLGTPPPVTPVKSGG